MEGGSRRNSSLDVAYATQICISATRMALGEMPHEHTKGKETQKYLGESCRHRIKCIAATFVTSFMWRRPLNSVTLVTTTHRKPKRVFDGTSTQVEA